jgi:hypothetical protein
MFASRRMVIGCAMLALSFASLGCPSRSDSGPPVPASSDPEGKDLVVGAVVIATEKGGGVRIYKVKKVAYFPPPVGDELVMIAFHEKGNDFKHAARLYRQRRLTVVLPNVRVPLQRFHKARDYRVIATEKVTEEEKKLKIDDKFPAKP